MIQIEVKIIACRRVKFLPRSRRDLLRSRYDVCKMLNLGEIAAKYPPSRRDYQDLAEICRDIAMMFVSF